MGPRMNAMNANNTLNTIFVIVPPQVHLKDKYAADADMINVSI
jgi:hypothetical protein